MFGSSNFAMLIAVLAVAVLVPTASSAGIRAAYGDGALKTWEGAQLQCKQWGGNLVKAEGKMAERLAKVKCTDVLWVGAHESPKRKGVNKDGWQWVSDASNVSGVWSTGSLVLVKKGSPRQCVFTEAAKLKAGEPASLALDSIPNVGVGKKYLKPQQYEDWLFIESKGVPRSNSTHVRYEDGNFLKLADEDLVLDISFAKMIEGNTVNYVGARPGSSAKTKESGGGRDWIVNDDSTISAKQSPGLVLGMEQIEPNNFGGVEEECGTVGWEPENTDLMDAPCDAMIPFACEIADLKEDEIAWVEKDDKITKLTQCWPDEDSDSRKKCFFNPDCTKFEREKNAANAGLIMALFLIVYVILTTIATICVSFYCCCHNTRTGKCCTFGKCTCCTGGAFCSSDGDNPEAAHVAGHEAAMDVECTRNCANPCKVAQVNVVYGSDSALRDTANQMVEIVPAIDNSESKVKGKAHKFDTSALDGLRGFAALHVAMSHYIGFSSIGFDLCGGQAMGLFYILSGFVMYIGYAQARLAQPTDGSLCKMACCWGLFDKCFVHGSTNLGEGKQVNAKEFWIKRLARLAPVYFFTNIAAVIVVASTGSDDEKFGLSWRVPLTALAVTTYIPWPDDQIGLFWPVNGVTWSIATMGFFYFSFPFLAPRLQRGVPAGQERVAAICLYLLQATWPLLIGSIFFILADPGKAATMWYWFVRAYPLCRFPVFMMGCLAGKLMIMHRQHTSATFMCLSNPTMCMKMSDLCLVIYLSFVVFYTMISSGVWGLQDLTVPIRLIWEVMLPMLFFDWVIALSGEETSATRTFFSSTVMRWVGDISMSFYMVHLLIWEWAVKIRNNNIPDKSEAPPAWLIPVCFPISILLGWLLTILFEKPAQKMVRRRFQIDKE